MPSLMNRFQLNGRWLGPEEPTYFIADIAANHDGDLSRAKRLIELAKEAGADVAKFQNFVAPKIVSKHGFEKLGKMTHQATWKKSVYEVYQDAETQMDWTAELKSHCDQIGITYMTTPYDKGSVDAVDPHVSAYKIGSGDITYTDMLEYMAKKGKPLFLATGASDLAEVAQAIETLELAAPAGTPLCLMQCNTNYTGEWDNFKYVQLNVLKTYALLYPQFLLGLSDHTPGHAAVLGAVALGARVIEKHFTDDNSRVGPDHQFSLNPRTWREMVDRTRELELALGGAQKRVEANERQSVVVQRRSFYTSRPVKRGEAFSLENFEALRPAPQGSIPPTDKDFLLGMSAARDYAAGDCIFYHDWHAADCKK